MIPPPAPVPEAVLKSPLPASEIVAELAAVTVKSPPVPPLLVLLSTLAPPVCVKLFTFSWMLPAFPVPEVATEIVPPPLIVKVGAVTLTWPALPVLFAVLNKPLPGPECGTLKSLAVTPSGPPVDLHRPCC